MNLFTLPKVAGGVQFGNVVLPVSDSILKKASGDHVIVGIRPENLEVSKSKGIDVEVDVIEELGADGYLYGTTKVEGPSHDIVSRVDGRVHPMRGDKVILAPSSDAIVHLFDASSEMRLN
jgi:multiple sugar transport system ATP-binding protein